ncbi:MAG: hypothetical protein IPN17_26620 [Deltaproteobacteria bacterium]|nr:hypothetical protein [Deltaproteobacteria bacterium]
MTGHTDEAIVEHGIFEAGLAYIRKPITIDLLTRRVREVLQNPSSAS